METHRNEISLSVDNCDVDLSVDDGKIIRLSRRVFSGENISISSVGIILTNHERLRALNVKYLSHDYNTDVLSFLIDESDDGIEGEVYVDVETAEERCAEFGVTVEEEVARYVIHGLLHLAGYEDDTAEKKAVMRQLENRYLNVH